MQFQITAHRGSLAIRPLSLTGFLKPLLRYTFRFSAKEQFSYLDQDTGKVVVGERRSNRTQSMIVNLFSEIDDYLHVHEGMYRRVENAILAAGHSISYAKVGPQFKEPELNPSVVRGLYPEQKECFVEMISSVSAPGEPGGSGAIVEATMGSGKTFVIAALCRAYKTKVLVTTKSKNVVRRLYNGLRELLQEDGIRVGLHQGSTRIDGDVIICTNALLGTFDPDDVDCLIFDEVHNAMGDETSMNVLRFETSVKFGLSATLQKRFDGKELLLEAMFGPKVYTLTDQEAEENNRVCPIRVYALSCKRGPDLSSWKSPVTKEKNGIWKNPHRNDLIMQAIQAVPPDQQLLVFVRTTEHLRYLEGLLPEDHDFKFFHGSLSEKESLEMSKGFEDGTIKRMISTDSLKEGVDPSQLMVVIDANWESSVANVAQRAGRVRRKAPGKKWGVLITFYDSFDQLCLKKTKSRLKEYERRGYQVFADCSVSDIGFVGETPDER